MQSTHEGSAAESCPSLHPTESEVLRPLMDPEEYRKRRAAHLLRTRESMKWFVRLYGPELIQNGALLKIANRWTVHADRFDVCLLQIGQDLAAAKPEHA